MAVKTAFFIYRRLFASLHEFFPIIKNFFIYSSGAFILRSTQFITTPITMSILSPSDYGMLALINSFISIGSAVCGLGLRQALPLEYFRGTKAEQHILVKEIIITYLLIISPLFLIALYHQRTIKSYFLMPEIPTFLVTASLIVIFIYFFTELIYQLLQYEGRAWELSILQIGVAFLTVGINLFLLLNIKLGIASIIIGQLVGMLMVCGISLRYALRASYITRKFSLEHGKRIGHYLKLGFPFLPSLLCGWMLATGDRFVLARYASLHDVGIYSIADTFGQMFQMIIIIPFSYAYLPNMMRKFALSENIMEMEKSNKKIMWLFIPACLIIITIGFLLIKPFLVWFLPRSYHEALLYVWLLLIAYSFLMVAYFPLALIQYYKKSYFISFSFCMPAVVNIGLNIILIPHYGIFGCVLATICANFLYCVLLIGYNYRLSCKLC